MTSIHSNPRALRALACLCALTICAASACSQAFTLTDGNARLDVDFSDPILTQTLTVDGLSISGETGYFTGLPFRISQGTPSTLSASWAFDTFAAGVDYRLEGGAAGEGTATVTEVVYAIAGWAWWPTRGYEYSHYDLSGAAPSADRATIQTPGVLEQTGPLGTLSVSSDTVPNHYEVGVPAVLLETLAGYKGEIVTLTDMPRPGIPFPTPPGDVAFAFQWEFPLNAGQMRTVAVTKRFTVNRPPDAVPEPGTLTLLGIAGLSLAARRRR